MNQTTPDTTLIPKVASEDIEVKEYYHWWSAAKPKGKRLCSETRM